MIKSLLDNDLYKFTMQNAVMKLYPHSKVKYRFFDRGENIFPNGFAKKLRERINAFSKIKLSTEEEIYLRDKCYFFDPVYIDFLKGFQYDPYEVKIRQRKNKISVMIEGYWYRTILWEVPILATISELYYEMTGQKIISQPQMDNLNIRKARKFEKLGARFADFGTRRRFSYSNHSNVVKILKEYAPNTFIGTSNVHLAYIYNLTPIGTQAHEWFMFHGARHGYKKANAQALDAWVEVYQGDLGIALTDTYTANVFFKGFSARHAGVFDGLRWDSGDPFEFTDKFNVLFPMTSVFTASFSFILSR